MIAIHHAAGLDPKLISGCSYGGWLENGAVHSAEAEFLAHQMFVVWGVPWDATDLEAIRNNLVPRHRAFKADYIDTPTPVGIQRAVNRIIAQAKDLFPQMYPSFKSIEERTSFRPMITGPEPLHFDSYGGKNPMVTAYINVSAVPRVYRISYNFPMLVDRFSIALRQALKERKAPGDDVSYPLRMWTQRGRGPLGPNAPRHEVHLPPGAIWFFNAKTVSHEVVYGEGAIGISWEVPGCGAKLQHELMKEIPK